MTKILLAIDEGIACIKDNKLPTNSIHLNGFGAIKIAQADAKELIKQVKLEVIDKVLENTNYGSYGYVYTEDILAIKSEIEKE
jgi:hypothetical protein